MRVLVTGAAGAIGQPVSLELARRGHTLRAFDRVPTVGVADVVIADLADAEAVRRAMQGMDALIHLAAMPDDGPFPKLVESNVLGLQQVLDAARSAGVGRVVLASSVQVAGKLGGDELRTAASAAPSNHYALTKLWAEQMGEMYARVYKMSIIAVRIGWMVRNEAEARRAKQHPGIKSYISRADIARFMLAAIETPNIDFAVLFAIGASGANAYDLETPRRLIGYVPEHAWPEGLPFPLPD